MYTKMHKKDTYPKRVESKQGAHDSYQCYLEKGQKKVVMVWVASISHKLTCWGFGPGSRCR